MHMHELASKRKKKWLIDRHQISFKFLVHVQINGEPTDIHIESKSHHVAMYLSHKLISTLYNWCINLWLGKPDSQYVQEV